MEDSEQDLDAETLQAQIDMSLAHTQNLVSSWLKPKYGNTSMGSSRANQEKELEELMKRPPRLGVGAPLPAATGVAGHEAMKLKGRLTGKKRPRDEQDINMAVISDDEGESRAGAIKKKARPDPFAPKPKKSANAAGVAAAKSAPSTSGRKPESSSKVAPRNSPIVDAKSAPSPSIENHPRDHTKAGAADSEDEQSEDGDSMDIDKPQTPTSSGGKDAGNSPSKGLPLLNLEGPPVPQSSPPKKKRKRNKKKKKGGKQQA